MQIGDEVGVVSFDDQGCDNVGSKAESNFNLTEITSETVRGNAISSVGGLTYRGCTSIGAGMQLAQTGPNLLDIATADNPHAMILLTDGFENRPPWVRQRPSQYAHHPATPDDILLTIPGTTDIYTIALGPNADEDLLKDIAATTGGKFYMSPTILGLLSIYYQIQGDLVLGNMTDLAVGTKSGGNDTRITTIDQGASQATFVVGWLQGQGELVLSIEDPAGVPLDLNSPGVFSGGDSSYRYFKIDNPLAGNWTVHMTRADSGTFNIDYTYAAFVKGSGKFWSFVPTFEEAGECLITKVHLYDDRTLQPLTGATVEAVVTYPRKYKFTLHHDFVNPSSPEWRPVQMSSQITLQSVGSAPERKVSDRPVWAETLERHNRESLDQTGRSIYEYDSLNVALYDDGTNGDEQAGDGVYTNCIDRTQVAGSYIISFAISGISSSGYRFTRRELASAFIEPGRIDQAGAMVRVDPPIINQDEGSFGTVTVIPKDGFGNVWGPGHASRIVVSTGAGRIDGGIVDNGDGFYFQRIMSTGVEESGPIVVEIDGEKLESSPRVTIGQLFRRYSLSVHASLVSPTGTMANNFDPGVGFFVDVDYHFTRRWSTVGLFGYSDFGAKSPGLDDLKWVNLTANVRHYRPINALRGFVGVGPGLYIDDGASKFGGNIGVGLEYGRGSSVKFEVGVDYHAIFDPDLAFVNTHAGVVYRF
jgi:hypothetical protein